jgi:hypothetical protein
MEIFIKEEQRRAVTGKTDRRATPDRRGNTADLLSRYIFAGGRRKTARRKRDREKPYVADFYGSVLWLKLLSIIALTLVDAYLTILLIDIGIAEELNPVMAFYMSYGPQSFVVMKLFITATPLFFLCLCKDLSITKITLTSSIMIYLTIVLYELSMLHKFYFYSPRVFF